MRPDGRNSRGKNTYICDILSKTKIGIYDEKDGFEPYGNDLGADAFGTEYL